MGNRLGGTDGNEDGLYVGVTEGRTVGTQSKVFLKVQQMEQWMDLQMVVL